MVENREMIAIIAIAIIISVGVSLATVNITGNATSKITGDIVAKTSGKDPNVYTKAEVDALMANLANQISQTCELKISLDTNNPSKSINLEGNTYTIRLISASDTIANIEVGAVDLEAPANKVLNEKSSTSINGLNVKLESSDKTGSMEKAIVTLSNC